MTKKFIGIKNERILHSKNGMGSPEPVLILDGYKLLNQDTKIAVDEKYLPFQNEGFAVPVDDNKDNFIIHKKIAKKKILLQSSLLTITTLCITSVAFEIKLHHVIKYKENIPALYIALILLNITFIFIIMKIISIVINMRLQNQAIERQLRYGTGENFYAGIRRARTTTITSEVAAVFAKIEAQVHRRVGSSANSIGYKLKHDIQYLHILYDDLNAAVTNSEYRDLHLKNNGLRNYLEVFIEEKYLNESMKIQCREMMKHFQLAQNNSVQSVLIVRKNLVIVKQIIYSIFENINCYHQYDVLELISRIVNPNFVLEDSELYRRKHDEFKLKE